MAKYLINLVMPVGILLALSSATRAQSSDSEGPIVRPELMRKVTESVYIIPDDFVRLVPNIGIVVGSTAILVVDTGLGIENGARVYEAVKELRQDKKMYTTITHYHPEHSLGVEGLGNDVVFIASDKQHQEMKAGDRIKNQFSRQSAANRELINNAPYPIPDILYDHNYKLDLGDLTVQLTSVGPLHTEGDSIIFINEEHVLFSGDIIMGGVIPSIDQQHATFGSWKTAIERIAKMSPQVIIGSHGDIGDQKLVDTWDRLISEISAAVLGYHASGFSKSQATKELTSVLSQKFPTWRNDRRRMSAAVDTVYR
jgi:glyoxylase-like metal-dependent hydrolase (beta-lactamase superfamily II)